MTTATTIKVQLQIRQDTAANWSAINPTLLAGELGRESDTGKIKIGNGSSTWSGLAYQPFGGQITDADISATAEIAVSKLADGAARQLLQTDAAGTGVEWTDNVDVPGTLDVTGAATFDDDVTIQGDLTVNGTTTTIDTTTLVVEDKNIEIGKVATPTDVTADGGGITLKGSTDKTISWVDATDAWTFSEHVDIASGKEYRIAGTKVLDATSLGSAVVSSSLTSVGTIGTGVWEGTTVATGYGGTGQTTYTDGELLIGKTDGTLAKATITQGSGVTITNGDGTITISATGSGGTVTSVDVTGGTGLTSSGGPITSSGAITIDLDNTAVTPGSYTYASITVDQQGRLTAASNGTAPLTSSDIGVTVQGYDADTAKLDTTQTFTAAQTFAADLTLNAQSDLRFADSDSSNWVALQAPATVASNVTWTLPDADGTSGQALITNGTGTLSWADAGGGNKDVQEFTSSGTWTKPAGVTFVIVQVTAGGEGGQGGSGGGTGRGGKGGNGGIYLDRFFLASTLSSTVAVTIGAGGAGGAGGTGSSASAGASGGATTFGGYVSTADTYAVDSYNFATGGSRTNGTSGLTGQATYFGGGSGGSGSGVSGGVGGDGLCAAYYGNAQALGGQANNLPGASGSVFSQGAGGGGYGSSGAGGNGAPGGGGGGGGAAANGTGATGGNGGNGYARIISW